MATLVGPTATAAAAGELATKSELSTEQSARETGDQRLPWSYRDHGLNACSVNDPVSASTTLAPEAGKPFYIRVPVRVASASFATVRLIVSTGASAEIANSFIAVYNSGGTRLGVSADQSTAWKTSGEKAIAITADEGKSLTVAGGTEVYVWIMLLIGTQGTTNAAFRAATATSSSPNFALVANSIVLRCGTVGTGKTEAPSSFTPAELAVIGGPILLGA